MGDSFLSKGTLEGPRWVIVFSHKGPWRLADNCQILAVRYPTTFRSDNCQIGQLSVGTTVRRNCQCSEKTVRSYSCPHWVQLLFISGSSSPGADFSPIGSGPGGSGWWNGERDKQ